MLSIPPTNCYLFYRSLGKEGKVVLMGFEPGAEWVEFKYYYSVLTHFSNDSVTSIACYTVMVNHYRHQPFFLLFL